MEALFVPYAGLCALTLLIGGLVHWVYRWINPPCTGALPPGSMGLPIIGETIQFFKTSPSLDIPSFYKSRLQRYGPIFKTSVVGKPLVVSADPEFNRFIFQQEGKLFRSWYPEAANIIIGEKTLDDFSGAAHKFVRTFMSRLFGIEYIKKELLPELEKHIRDSLAEWAAQPNIDVNDSTTDVIFDLVAKKLVGLHPTKSRELRNNYNAFLQGLISYPIYFPGTTFYRCMQGKKNMLKIMSDILRQRQSTPNEKHGDLLDLMVQELQSEKPTIDEKFATDALSGLLFTSFVTLSPNLTLAFKFLSDNPNVLDALKKEHEAILNNREDDACSGLSWEEYKSLNLTPMVLNEITRMTNATPGIFRKTLTDVQVNGYTIPAGWMVMMNTMAIHLDPTSFEEPLNFNPWRWLDESKQNKLKNFVPFGLGIRACPAVEFSKAFMALFLHVLVTKYSWKKIEGGEVARKAVIMFPQQYKIQLVPMQ